MDAADEFFAFWSKALAGAEAQGLNWRKWGKRLTDEPSSEALEDDDG